MRVRRGVAGLMGLALLVGAAGCGKVGEKIAEEAVERNSNCSDVDINTEEGGFSGNCEGQDLDVNVAGNAELPDGWPSDLAPPEGFNIVTSQATSNPTVLNVIGGLDGEVGAVYEGVKTQLTAAGFTIEGDSLTDGPTGQAGVLSATGTEFRADVTVSEVENAVEGNITVTYTLTAL